MKLEEMKVYLLCADNHMYECFKREFEPFSNVIVVNDFFKTFMESYKDIECIVSPANAYGYMSGGYDAAISDYLGWDFQNKVQEYIKTHYYGEQPLGTSFIIEDCKTNKKLIHTPTMRYPSKILDPTIVYQCMRTTLMCALENNIKSIVIPPFGGGTGKLSPNIISEYMVAGYVQLLKKHRLNYF